MQGPGVHQKTGGRRQNFSKTNKQAWLFFRFCRTMDYVYLLNPKIKTPYFKAQHNLFIDLMYPKWALSTSIQEGPF